jgi:hypothetical protein
MNEHTKEEWIDIFASDLKNKCNHEPNMDLLNAVTDGLGQVIHWVDGQLVSGSQQSELDTVKNNFLVKKLGLEDSPALYEAIDAVLTTYGTSNPQKYRAVVYYLLTVHFGKESVYA